jgi:hypothetical protein
VAAHERARGQAESGRIAAERTAQDLHERNRTLIAELDVTRAETMRAHELATSAQVDDLRQAAARAAQMWQARLDDVRAARDSDAASRAELLVRVATMDAEVAAARSAAMARRTALARRARRSAMDQASRRQDAAGDAVPLAGGPGQAAP